MVDILKKVYEDSSLLISLSAAYFQGNFHKKMFVRAICFDTNLPNKNIGH